MSHGPGGASPRGRIARATPDDTARQALALAEARLQSEATAAGERFPLTQARVAVVGAGAMGSTIAMAAAKAGLDVVLVDRDPARLRAAVADIDRWSERTTGAGSVEYTTDLARIRASKVVIESITEDAALKTELLVAIEDQLQPGTLITTNTSSLDIDQLAMPLRHRARFLGTHFFLPAHRIPVLEVVRGSDTTADAFDQALALAGRLAMMPVCVGNAPKFVGNRLFDCLWQEAVFLVEEGALPEEVDGALEQWGLALGPFATLDRIGLSLIDSVSTRQRQQTPRTSSHGPSPGPSLVGVLCKAGRTGIAAHRGWFDYAPGSRRGVPSDDVRQLLERWSRELGRTRRTVSVDEIVARPVLAVIDEARGLLARGIARRPGDIDVLFTRAYGFPSWSGGPLALAATLGPEALREDAARFPHRGAMQR
jgi:3-hydroxyacyl-CoA dehydrogenase